MFFASIYKFTELREIFKICVQSIETLYYTSYTHTSMLWLKGPGQGQTPSLEARGYTLSRLKIEYL